MTANWDQVVGRLVIVGAAIVVVGTVVGSFLPHDASLDVSISTFLAEHRTGWLTRTFQFITAAGASDFLTPFAMTVAVILVVRDRSARPAVFITVASLGAMVLYQTIKSTVGRSRPAIAPIVEFADGHAFPSGHAAQSIALYGAIAYAAFGHAARDVRVRVGIAVLVWAALIGFSRIYLGVHWTSDVIAGWILGAVWLTMCRDSVASSRRGRPAVVRPRARS